MNIGYGKTEIVNSQSNNRCLYSLKVNVNPYKIDINNLLAPFFYTMYFRLYYHSKMSMLCFKQTFMKVDQGKLMINVLLHLIKHQ